MSDLKRVEKFKVEAPVEWVWKPLMSADQLAAWLPGARLDSREVYGEEEEEIWNGALSFSVGALPVELAGRATRCEIDYYEHSFKLTASEGEAKLAVSCKLVAIPAEGIEDPLEAEAAEQCEAVFEIDAVLSDRLASMDRTQLEQACQGLLAQFIESVRSEMADAKAAIARESLRSELDELKGVLDESARELEAAQRPPVDSAIPETVNAPAELSGKKRLADKKRRSSEANMKLVPVGAARYGELSAPLRFVYRLRDLVFDLGQRIAQHLRELLDGPLRRLLRRS